jgi:photosystem II stability/assembly factor-like uncharacterized protein
MKEYIIMKKSVLSKYLKNFTIPILFFIGLGLSSADAQWVNVGDGLLGQYSRLYGGAMTYKDGIVWAGLTTLFKSVDTGKTWVKVPLELSNISDICFFSKDIGAVIDINTGAYYTVNGGNTWTHILTVGECFGVSFARNGNELFVADRDNLRGSVSYTSDGGLTWSKTQVEGSGGGAYHAIYNPASKTAYVLSRNINPIKSSHINISTDFGRTWSRPPGEVDIDSYSMALDSCDPNKVYIINEEYNEKEDGSSEVYTSLDNGQSWKITERQGPNFFAASSAMTPNVLYIGSSLGQGVFRSIDRGLIWKSIGGPTMHQDCRFLCAINDNIIFGADESGSIWRTINSGGDSVVVVPSSANLSFKFHSGTIISDSFGVTVQLPIYVKHTGTMGPVDMVVHYPDGPLKYLGSFLYYGKSIDVAGSRWSGRAKLHIDADDLNALTDSLVGFAAFKWFPLEFDCSQVHFDSITSSLQIAADCSGAQASAMDSTRGIIGAYKYCDPLADVMAPSTSKPLFSFAPNPVGAIGSIYSSIYDGPLDVSIYDMTGKLVLQLKDQISPVSPMKCNLIDLASGVYHLAIEGRNLLPYDITFVHTK